MRLRPPLSVSVTRHGDKEQKLKDFIIQHVLAASDTRSPDRARQIQVIARSVESPVAKAIAGLGVEIAAAGVSVRMILAHADQDTFADAWTQAGRAVGFEHEVRWARHPRLIEAHEQLVLGPHTCWIGDSMRRDPAKCDAFESYVEGCGEAAGCALVSFERLWIASEPLVAHGARTGGSVADMLDGIAKPDGTGNTIAATRH